MFEIFRNFAQEMFFKNYLKVKKIEVQATARICVNDFTKNIS